ncbi:MAG: RNA polymerase sigma factor [Acidobacteriota bacterium]
MHAAFQDIVKEFHPRLLRFFRSRGFSAAIGEELAQETFLRLYNGRATFRGDVPLASWIFTIAANAGKHERRRRATAKRSGLEHPLDDVDTPDPIEAHTGGERPAEVAEPLARTLARERIALLQEEIDRMPPRMHQVMSLSIRQEWSITDIATLMQITESTVKVQLHQGRKRLRKALTERFGAAVNRG